jgi:hypothetical protein
MCILYVLMNSFSHLNICRMLFGININRSKCDVIYYTINDFPYKADWLIGGELGTKRTAGQNIPFN